MSIRYDWPSFFYVLNVPVKIFVAWGAQNCKTDDLQKEKEALIIGRSKALKTFLSTLYLPTSAHYRRSTHRKTADEEIKE